MRKKAHGIESIKTASGYVKRKEEGERRREQGRKEGKKERREKEGNGREGGKERRNISNRNSTY